VAHQPPVPRRTRPSRPCLRPSRTTNRVGETGRRCTVPSPPTSERSMPPSRGSTRITRPSRSTPTARPARGPSAPMGRGSGILALSVWQQIDRESCRRDLSHFHQMATRVRSQPRHRRDRSNLERGDDRDRPLHPDAREALELGRDGCRRRPRTAIVLVSPHTGTASAKFHGDRDILSPRDQDSQSVARRLRWRYIADPSRLHR
jgi:hypothetical protein